MRPYPLLLVLFAAAACRPDDDTATDTGAADVADADADADSDADADADADADSDADTDIPAEERIQGDWVSEGDDISPLFQNAFFDYQRIDATFGADGTYSVSATDGSGGTSTYTGTYTVAVDTQPGTIVVEQTVPSLATAEGIWDVDTSGVLTYEVVQTTPDIGFAPPTPSGGFGSTTGTGLAAGDNVQVFRRP